MATYPGQCTRVSGSNESKKQTSDTNKQHESGQSKPFPLFLVLGLVTLLIFWMINSSMFNSRNEKMMNYYSSQNGHEQRMAELRIQELQAQKELEEARAKQMMQHAQIVIPPTFPKGE